MPQLPELRPIRSYGFIPAPASPHSLAERFTPEIDAKARALGLKVQSVADPSHHCVIYSFGPADNEDELTLYVARGAHSALRFLDHHAARH